MKSSFTRTMNYNEEKKTKSMPIRRRWSVLKMQSIFRRSELDAYVLLLVHGIAHWKDMNNWVGEMKLFSATRTRLPKSLWKTVSNQLCALPEYMSPLFHGIVLWLAPALCPLANYTISKIAIKDWLFVKHDPSEFGPRLSSKMILPRVSFFDAKF